MKNDIKGNLDLARYTKEQSRFTDGMEKNPRQF